MKRLTLYQQLKPEVIAGLECVDNQMFHCSINNILDLLKSEQYYSDLTIEDVKNIILFSDVNPKSVFDMQCGDFLFEPNLDKAP